VRKSGYKPTPEELQQITTMTAAGYSQRRIAKAIGRSQHLVTTTQKKPEIQRAIKDEKAELAELYRDKARDVLASICDADIKKASLQQKAVSTGILLDKSLVLTGEPTENLNIKVLFEVAQLIRQQRDEESERQFQQAQRLPPITDRSK
jgi:IS30 family transposase